MFRFFCFLQHEQLQRFLAQCSIGRDYLQVWNSIHSVSLNWNQVLDAAIKSQGTICKSETPFILFLRTGCSYIKPRAETICTCETRPAGQLHSFWIWMSMFPWTGNCIQIQWSYNKPRTETICTCETRPAELIHISYNEERPPPTQCTWNRMPH